MRRGRYKSTDQEYLERVLGPPPRDDKVPLECKRCGRPRRVKNGRSAPLCKSCVEVCTDLGELDRWR